MKYRLQITPLSRIVENIEGPNSTQIKGLNPYEEIIYDVIMHEYYATGRPLNITDSNVIENIAAALEDNDVVMDNLDEIGNCCFKFLAMGLISAKARTMGGDRTDVYITFPHRR